MLSQGPLKVLQVPARPFCASQLSTLLAYALPLSHFIGLSLMLAAIPYKWPITPITDISAKRDACNRIDAWPHPSQRPLQPGPPLVSGSSNFFGVPVC